MRAVLEQSVNAKKVNNRASGVFGSKIGVFGKVFGCWHKDLSRPFTTGRESYRSCLECGARRRFDQENLKTFGSFYYPPAVSFAGKN